MNAINTTKSDINDRNDLDSSSKTVASVLGEIVWLMTQSSDHRNIPISDLQTLIMPPILFRQFRIFYKEAQPIAVVLYALVSEEVASRIDAGSTLLVPTEWQSGKRPMIVSVIAPFGNAEAFSSETIIVIEKALGL